MLLHWTAHRSQNTHLQKKKIPSIIFRFQFLRTEQSYCYSLQAFVYWRKSTKACIVCVFCVRLTIKCFRALTDREFALLSEPDLWSSLLWTKAYTDTERERECDLDDSSKFGQECQQPQDILVSRQCAHKFTSANYTAAIRSQKPIREPDPYLNHDCQNCFIHPMPEEFYTGQVWVPVPVPNLFLFFVFLLKNMWF